MLEYKDVVHDVIDNGTRKENRTGIDTLSIFNYNYSICLPDGFPLLTSKQINWKNIVIETLWFLSGGLNVEFLHKHNVHFWDDWIDNQGNVPSAYGNFWRAFPDGHGGFLDQVSEVVRQLEDNPNSRRLAVTAWSPGNALVSALPPCHMMWVLNVQRNDEGEPRLCMHLTQRSCDVALGLPYNIAGYALIQQLIAQFVGIPVGEFGHTLIDAHIYTSKPDSSMSEYDHIPGLMKQMERPVRPLPSLYIDSTVKTLKDLEWVINEDTKTIVEDIFQLDDYHPHPAINFKVAV